MTALFPYARLVRLADNVIVATTSNIPKGSLGRILDKPGHHSITVPLGDAGNGVDDASGFANALLAAVGGPGLVGTPVPTLCEVSLDGGTTIDARWLVETVTPDLHAGQLTLTCSGDAAGSLYGSSGPDRFPARDIALADVLGGAQDAIVPQSATYFGIVPLPPPQPPAEPPVRGSIPGLSGVLNAVPGDQPGPAAPLWVKAARTRFAAQGVLDNSLYVNPANPGVAFLGADIDSWEDTTLRLITSMIKILGGAVFATDGADQGSRGHAVWCDADANLSGDMAGVVCDGTPTAALAAVSGFVLPGPSGAHGYSNAAGRGGSGATGTCTLGAVGRLVAISGVTGGSGYTPASTFAVTGGGGSGAQVQPVLSGGVITGFLIGNKGVGYTSTPTLAQTGGPGTGGGGTCVLGYPVVSVTAGGGSAYWCGAQVTITPAGGDTTGTGALAALDIAGGVPGVSGYGVTAGRLVAPGRDYTTAPSMTITGRVGVPNALVVGNVGNAPRGVAFTFDASSTTSLTPDQEPSTARVLPDQTSLLQDLTTLYGEIRLTGGTNDAGLATGETITSIITLNNGGGDSWMGVLPLVGTNQQDIAGNLYYDAGDGQLRPIPSWGNTLPIYDLQVDNQNGVLYASTSQGVFRHLLTDPGLGGAFITSSAVAWTRVGGLASPCTRVVGVGGTLGAFWLYALVSGVSPDADGVYQYIAGTGTPSPQTGAGYDHWVRFVAKENLIDMVASDSTSCFFLDKADQQANLWLYDSTSTTTPYRKWALLAGQGMRLDRVIDPITTQDSVWIATTGTTSAGCYLLYRASGLGWHDPFSGPYPIDLDASLSTAVGIATGIPREPQIHRAVAGGVFNGMKYSVLLCTDAGLYGLPPLWPPPGLTDGWQTPVAAGAIGWDGRANGMNGLAGLALTNLVYGAATSVPDPYDPTLSVTANRLYAISGSSLFYSYSDGRYWRDLCREPLGLGPFFFSLAARTLGTLPDVPVQTIGPMALSPIGAGAGSHVTVAGCLPTDWYWRRRTNFCYEPYYALIPGTVPSPQVYTEQITEVAVTPSVPLAQASEDLAALAIVLGGEHATKQPTLEMHATFTQQESGLRFLWPTHQVLATQTGHIKMLSSDGTTLIDTTYINLTAQALYVLAHQIDWDGPLFSTTTQMGASVRGTPQTGADLAAALVQDLRRIRTRGLRTKR